MEEQSQDPAQVCLPPKLVAGRWALVLTSSFVGGILTENPLLSVI